VLGEEFADMDATGTAKTNSAELVYPLIRSRETNLNASVGYERKALTDDLDSVDSHVDKTSRQWHVGLAGNVSDGLGGGGYNALSLVFTQGRLAIATRTRAPTTPRPLAPPATLPSSTSTTARTAHYTEPATEHCPRRAVRRRQSRFLGEVLPWRPEWRAAYPQERGAWRLGGRASAELRQTITPWATAILGGKDKLYASVFYDHGTVRINKDRWNGRAATNTRSLRGAGIGLFWQRDERASIRLDYAWKRRQRRTTADKDRHGRLWLQGCCASDPAVRAYPWRLPVEANPEGGTRVVATVPCVAASSGVEQGEA
jgi:hemolysin activation/secretion protein